jgi:hypothetical protein
MRRNGSRMKRKVRCSFMSRAVAVVDGWRDNECLRLMTLMTE